MYRTIVILGAFVAYLMLGGAAFAATKQVEVENMKMPADGYLIQSDAAASGGKYVNLHKNRTVSTSFSGAVDKLTVRAKGRYYGGAWPRMVVKIDGTTVMSRLTNSSTFQDFTVDLSTNIADGSHNLSVSFTNDYYNRDLHVDVVSIDSGGTAPTTADGVNWCPASPERLALTANEQEMLKLHNQARSQNGVGALCVDSRLVKAARLHAQDMVENDYFSHTSQDGRTAGDRISAQGYKWRTYGENIASGSGSYGMPQNVFDRWMNSEGHRSNILSSNFKDVGIGEAIGEYKGTQDTHMWVANFGAQQ